MRTTVWKIRAAWSHLPLRENTTEEIVLFCYFILSMLSCDFLFDNLLFSLVWDYTCCYKVFMKNCIVCIDAASQFRHIIILYLIYSF